MAAVSGQTEGSLLLIRRVIGRILYLLKFNMSSSFCSSEHYSTITLTFFDRSSETELKVECRGVPDNEEERTKEGWKRYYFEAIKQTFGYGARLYWRHSVPIVLFSFLLWIFKRNLSFNLSGTRSPSCKLIARVNERDQRGEGRSVTRVCVCVCACSCKCFNFWTYLNLDDFSPCQYLGHLFRGA